MSYRVTREMVEQEFVKALVVPHLNKRRGGCQSRADAGGDGEGGEGEDEEYSFVDIGGGTGTRSL